MKTSKSSKIWGFYWNNAFVNTSAEFVLIIDIYFYKQSVCLKIYWKYSHLHEIFIVLLHEKLVLVDELDSFMGLIHFFILFRSMIGNKQNISFRKKNM